MRCEHLVLRQFLCRKVFRQGSYDRSFSIWNAALDSLEIELPDTVANTGTLTSTAVLGYKRECRAAIEACGLKVKV